MDTKKGGSGDLDPSDFDFGAEDTSGGDKGGSAFDFGFDEMPTPQGNAPRSATFEKPVDDGGFGEDASFGGADGDASGGFGDTQVDEGFAPTDDFGGGNGDSFAGDGFAPQGDTFEQPAATGEDAFGGDQSFDGGDGFVVEETETLVVAEDGAVDEAIDDRPVDDRTFLQKNMFNIAAGIAIVVVGGLGWMTFAPMLLPGPAPVQQTIATSQNSPTGMPNAPMTQDNGAAPSLPGNGAQPTFVDNANGGNAPSLPGLQVPTGTQPDAGLQPVPVDNLPQTPVVADSGNAPTVPTLELGGASTPAPTTAEVAAMQQEITDLKSQVATLTEQLEGVLSQPKAPLTPEPAVVAQDKPQVLDGWVLRGVEGDVAWVEGPQGFVEVQVGTPLPGAGVVENIQMYENEWLIVTTDGVILKP